MVNRTMDKIRRQNLRAHRVRSKIVGTSAMPRLSVHISNRNIIAQIIDDQTGKTLAYASTTSAKAAPGTMTEQAKTIGAQIAKKAKTAKVGHVVFDRGSRQYHGRIKALADAARENGLEF